MVLILNNLRAFANLTLAQSFKIRFGCSLLLNRSEHRSAGIVVIGDEVLKGQVQDSNSRFLAKKLYQNGYRVEQIIVVPDNVQTISETYRTFSTSYDVVLSTGGIGPTHDDVTFEALALAFNDELHYHPSIVEMCKEFYKISVEDDKHPGLKLARIPKSAKLTYGVDPNTGQPSLYPNISVRNVYIFPGVPSLCEKMYGMIQDKLFQRVGVFHNDCLFLNCMENEITNVLNEAVEKYPLVTFGSYPNFFHSYYRVKITLESSAKLEVDKAKRFLEENIANCNIINYDENCFKDKALKLQSVNSAKLHETMDKLSIILDKFNNSDIFVCFDGGKNSSLLMHLVATIFEGTERKINAIHIVQNKGLPFVKNTVKHYDGNLLCLDRKNFERFIKSDRTILLIKGTRASDPKSVETLKYFSEFNTYNPLLHWSYFEVWEIVRKLFLPYCDLYDRGFSSLSGLKNPKLITEGPRKDMVYYKSAYLLENESLE